MRLTYRDSEGRAHWIAELLEDTSGDSAEFIRRTVADYEDEFERKQPGKDRIPGRCEDCDFWNTWDHAGHKGLGNYVCSCARWTGEDSCTWYTKPDDFCSGFVPREEETP